MTCQCSASIRDAFAAGGLAAALRATADEVAPFPGRYPMNEWMEGFRDAKQSVHHQLLAIAAELESHS